MLVIKSKNHNYIKQQSGVSLNSIIVITRKITIVTGEVF